MTEQQSGSDKEPMTVGTFLRLVQTLPPERISSIPVESLPDNIPSNIAHQLPSSSRQAVESLLLAANSYHLARRLKDEDAYGKDIVEALDRARSSGETANIRIFKDKILNMVSMLQDYQRNKKSYPIALFSKNIVSVNDLLIDVRSQLASVYKTIEVLKSVEAKSEADATRFELAIQQLQKQSETIERLLSEYYIFRIKIMARAINEKRKAVEEEETRNAHIPQLLAELRSKLEVSRTFWKRKLKPRKTGDQALEIQQQISDLMNEMKQNEVVISETDLTLWLDAIVDASINPQSVQRASRPVRDARISLYFLLTMYCRKQEESALQIAQNPFMHVEPEKAIQYVLLSEQFILDYFANKKKDTTAWLSGAAKSKIDELDRLQKDLLSELRRANKIAAR
ncbi:MAG: hypothetical protein U9R74_11160 [Pseudomonadota bacterium]|nr:hypothetical protein [Pseudomonadota bacterium]